MPVSPPPLKYLLGYPEAVLAQVRQLLAQGRLGERLQGRYADPHEVRTDAALYAYTHELKSRHLRNAGPLSKVVFDTRLHLIQRLRVFRACPNSAPEGGRSRRKAQP